MKRFTLILALFVSLLSAQLAIGASAQVNNVDNIGGCAATAIAQAGNFLPHGTALIQLQGGSSGGTNSTLQILQKASGTTQGAYRTPSGKVFHAYGGCFYTSNTSGDSFSFSQSTAAPTQGLSSGSPPAGSVHFNADGAVGNAAHVQSSGIRVPAASAWYWIPLNGLSFGTVAAQYYPYWTTATATASQEEHVILFGWEDAIDY